MCGTYRYFDVLLGTLRYFLWLNFQPFEIFFLSYLALVIQANLAFLLNSKSYLPSFVSLFLHQNCNCGHLPVPDADSLVRPGAHRDQPPVLGTVSQSLLSLQVQRHFLWLPNNLDDGSTCQLRWTGLPPLQPLREGNLTWQGDTSRLIPVTSGTWYLWYLILVVFDTPGTSYKPDIKVLHEHRLARGDPGIWYLFWYLSQTGIESV